MACRQVSRQVKRPGRPRRYETPEHMQEVIDAYFARAANPTVSGLTLALGFTSRQSLLNYRGYCEEFRATVGRARLRIEDYYERMLQDPRAKPGAAIFALKNLGWRGTPEPDVMDLPRIQVICNASGSASDPVPGAGPQSQGQAPESGDG